METATGPDAANVSDPRRSVSSALWSFWRRGSFVERAGYGAGALLLVSGLVHLAIVIGGAGSWEGPLSWRKPATFGMSFGLTLITITWVASFLRLGKPARAILLASFTVACVVETALVTLQTWRGVPSHFNVETTLDGSIARTLAAGGFTLVAVIVALTVVAFRANAQLPASLRSAIRIGFVALLGAAAAGGLMIAKGMMLVFTGNEQAAYAIGGTLKPTHAVTMHAILILPALAWLLSFANWSEGRRLAVVRVAAGGYLLLTGVVVAANFAGVEPWQMPAPLVALAAVGALALTIAAIVALAAAHRALQ
jgi:hypothetical protein